LAAKPTREFRIAGACWTVQFSGEAAAVMNSHRQYRWHQKETVGQLFCPDLTSPAICITEATVLTRVKASRTSVSFDPDEAEQQRISRLGEGLYCVGLWHTHAEGTPSPSRTDENLAADHALTAQSVLNGLCFVIVGTAASETDWYVSVHDGQNFHVAQHVE
jgi:proteasome lid subunit RPN8/RPN11